MKTIIDASGELQNLSDDIYEITGDDRDFLDYTAGTRVRLISGIQNSKIPGYHFNENYVTVCRLDAVKAEFVGILKSNLKKVE